MAATITSSGTWSAFQTGNAVGQGPGGVQNEQFFVSRDTVEQRGESLNNRGVNYRPDFTADVDGEQELNQYVGLWSAATGVPTRAIWTRIWHLSKAVVGAGSETPEQQRVYAP